jgi:hypothetical protein
MNDGHPTGEARNMIVRERPQASKHEVQASERVMRCLKGSSGPRSLANRSRMADHSVRKPANREPRMTSTEMEEAEVEHRLFDALRRQGVDVVAANEAIAQTMVIFSSGQASGSFKSQFGRLVILDGEIDWVAKLWSIALAIPAAASAATTLSVGAALPAIGAAVVAVHSLYRSLRKHSVLLDHDAAALLMIIKSFAPIAETKLISIATAMAHPSIPDPAIALAKLRAAEMPGRLQSLVAQNHEGKLVVVGI